MDSASTRFPLSSRLTTLRCLVPKVLVGQEDIAAVEKLAKSWLLSCPSSNAFGEECEVVVTLLYTTLVLPDCPATLLPQELVFTFIERWVVYGGRMELTELAYFLKPEWKCCATKVLFLLCANLMPSVWGSSLEADVSEWSSEWLLDTPPPTWLLDAVGSSGDMSDFLTVLRVSGMLLQSTFDLPKVEPGHTYLGMLTKFFYAACQYQKGQYSCSLGTLQTINPVVCEEKLQAWISFLEGLCLSNTKKPHTALMKLQDAVNKSSALIVAMFNMAKAFHSLGQLRAELEVLELLVKSGTDDKGSASLHSSLLALHYHTPEDFSNRVRYFMSCRLLQAKEFEEAAIHLESLLKSGIPTYGSCDLPAAHSLLRPADAVPALPDQRVVVVLAGVAHASTDSHRDTIRILDYKFLGETDIGGSSFYDDSSENKLRVVVTAAGRVLRAKALAGLDHVTEALRECIRVEQSLWWVKSMSDSDDVSASVKEWNVIILLLKIFLYKLMSELHKTRNIHQNHLHYTRLLKQCEAVLREAKDSPTWGDVSLSHQFALDGIHDYLKDRSRL